MGMNENTESGGAPSAAERRERNIVLLSDGTGNGAAKRHRTNVWRLYRALDVHRPDQIACYDDGVGSQDFLLFKIIGGAFGWGLGRNVLELYRFLCRAYTEGDRIYLFGFSRGAFTVRFVADMVAEMGLVSPESGEFDRLTREVYLGYRYRRDPAEGHRPLQLWRWVRKLHGHISGATAMVHDTEGDRVRPPIEFVGVWDTVDAYGLPVDELAVLWHQLISPIRFTNNRLHDGIRRAAHALAIDDERRTFHPVLWDQSREADRRRIRQVWFPGAHADVGGGYPTDDLALTTLDWMMSQVEASDPDGQGLHFIESARDDIRRHSDWNAPQHDSRSGLGAYYRYEPRNIVELCGAPGDAVHVPRPLVYCGTFERIAEAVVPYAPLFLPQDYAVEVPGDVQRRGGDAAWSYETDTMKQSRIQLPGSLRGVIAQRRRLHTSFLVTTALMLSVPWWGELTRGGLFPLADAVAVKFVALAMAMLPDALGTWLAGFAERPWTLWLFAAVFARLAVRKAYLAEETRRRAMAAWSALCAAARPPA